ncbi:DUF192 domain-containing protein [Merismopedia glauca]|uniref:DUF192 domain-containing protein n=1 Tax=Merismopedia glauca CCAP 1448/3 TaxID=1296344 RepID=A0A2T1C6P1_9CYAN|nr:DUF192 domain-containing protein [Merismopedia glauca]PSB03945.1 hypothetical protein C7B64_06155 [Merismopedia glauca CCAP 1448/3]
MIHLNLSSILVGILVLACNSPTSTYLPSSTSTPHNPSETIISPKPPIPENFGQNLPITAKTTLKNQTIEIEVAQTPQQQTIGLMYRKVLPANRGMLFPFNPPQPVSFWMKNTLIPLDIIFISNGKVRSIASSVPPCQKDPCPTYGPTNSREIIDNVLELPAGRAQELGLQTGSEIEIEFIKTFQP